MPPSLVKTAADGQRRIAAKIPFKYLAVVPHGPNHSLGPTIVEADETPDARSYSQQTRALLDPCSFCRRRSSH
jgi:hypothetical protein